MTTRHSTDTDYLASVLSDGAWHSLDQILHRSYRDRGFGLTVHSRAADLRRRDIIVENRLERGLNGRVISSYRVVSLAQPEESRSPSGYASEASAVGDLADSSTAATFGELERAEASSTPIPGQLELEAA